MIDKVLKKALILDGNDTTNIKDEKTYKDFQHLLIELSKIKYNIRYCSNNNCPCHPESEIKKLLENEYLCGFLHEVKLLDDIKLLITDYKPITVFDKGFEK